MKPSVEVCTPISVDFVPEPVILWADLRGVRFSEPSFRATLSRVHDERPKLITGIEALRALDDRPTLDPALIVFQVSRCGSTLVAQLFAALAQNLVIAEANPINQILASPLPPAEKVELLRLVVRALGRQEPGAQQLILKLTSWNVFFAEIVQQAFPAAPKLWLQRDPLAVLASHVAEPARWSLWPEGDAPPPLFRLDSSKLRHLPREELIFAVIEDLYRAAWEVKSASAFPLAVVDYAELPDAAWGKIATHARLVWRADDVGRMRERALYSARSAAREPFVQRDLVSRLPEETRRRVAQRIEPTYRALGLLREPL